MESIGLFAFAASFLIPLFGMMVTSNAFVRRANATSTEHMHERLQQHAVANRMGELHRLEQKPAEVERLAA